MVLHWLVLLHSAPPEDDELLDELELLEELEDELLDELLATTLAH